MDELLGGNGAYSFLIALVIPAIVGALTKAQWPAWAKFSCTVILSAVTGLATVKLTGVEWTAANVLGLIVALVGTSEASFRYLIEKLGLKAWLADHFVK